jgi:hypothetical protein
MTDTSVLNSRDDPDDQAPPPTWKPPGPPSALSGIAQRAAPQPPVWQRGMGRTDQPTTVASLGPQPQAPQPPQVAPVAPQPPAAPPQTVRPKPQPWSPQPPKPAPSPLGTPELSPTGAPPPIRSFSPYIPAQPIRDHSDWGQPQPFAREPQSFEVPGIYHGVGQFFGGNGSAITALLGSGLVKNSGAFMKSYMQGAEFASKQRREDMQDHAMELDQKQQEETDAYAEVFNTYNAVGYKPVNGVRIEDAIGRVAMRYGDQNMQAVLAQGPGAAYKLLQNRDAKWQDLHAGNTKAKDTSADAALWGLTPAQPAGEGEDASGLPATLGAPASSAAAPSLGAEPPPAAAKSGAAPGAASDEPPDTPIEGGAVSVFKGIEPGAYVPADVKNRMAVRANEMKGQVRQILKDPSITPDQVVPEVRRKLGSDVADELQAYMDYRRGPGVSGQSSGGKEQEYWNTLGTLASKAKPGDPAHGVAGWSQSNFAAISKFKSNNQIQNAIGRAVTVTTTGDQILNDVEQLPPEAHSGNALSEAFGKIKDGAFTGDQRYVALYNDWLKYNQETNVLIRGGQGGITETEASVNIVPPLFGNPADYRTVVVHDAEMAASRLGQYENQWKQYGSPDPMPGTDEFARGELHRISSLEPIHNLQPGGTVEGADGVTRRWLGPYDEKGHLRTNPAKNWEPVT